MYNKNILISSKNPAKEILEELSLFEQTLHCEKFIRKTYKNVTNDIVSKNSKIASACFRQAKEYLMAGNSATISTSPLLYSYCLNNYAKGMTYLSSSDEHLLKGFRGHGFKSRTRSLVTESSIKIRKGGVINSLCSLVQHDSLSPGTLLTFEDIITLIPGIQNALYISTEYVSKIAYKGKDDNYLLCMFDNEDNFNYSHPDFTFDGTFYKSRDDDLHYLDIRFSIEGNSQIAALNGLRYNNENYIFMPSNLNGKEILLQPMVASYLLLMHYSMYVRYRAHDWDEIVDPKTSNTFTLIDLSIQNAVATFISDMHRFLTNKDIVLETYTDKNVEIYINKNIGKISEKVEKEFKKNQLIRNRAY